MRFFVFHLAHIVLLFNQTELLQRWGGVGEEGYSKTQNSIFVLAKRKITFILQDSILLKYYTERKVELFVGKQGNFRKLEKNQILCLKLENRQVLKITHSK